MFLPGGGGTMLVCGRLGGWGGGGRGRCGGRRDGGGRRDRGPFSNCLLACGCGCGFGKVDLPLLHRGRCANVKKHCTFVNNARSRCFVLVFCFLPMKESLRLSAFASMYRPYVYKNLRLENIEKKNY